MKDARAFLAAVASVVLVVGVLTLTSAVASAASSPPAISWLAAGDSFASGQGLAHPIGKCQQGTGAASGGEAWALSAAATLKAAGITFAGGSPDLVACTGAISDQFFHADGAKTGAPQWKSSMKRYDLVTFSFGGDDIQFKSTISECTILAHQCAPANTERNKITELGSTGDYVKGIHEPGFPTFLDNVAKEAVVKGGNVVVMGYPDIFENPTKWGLTRAVNNQATCSGFDVQIVDRMRGWGGDLNATLGEAVLKVNAQASSARNDVHFTFINPTTGGGVISASDPNLFEPSTGTHHELCSTGDQPWLNGFSLEHPTHSYHPNVDGENAMGALAAEVIAGLSWPWGTEMATTTCQTDATTPNPKPTPPTELFSGSVAGLGHLTMYTDNEQTALLAGPAGWPCQAVSGADADTTLTIPAPGTSLNADSQISSGLQAYVIPGADDLGQFLLTCALFPAAETSVFDPGRVNTGEGYDCGPAPPPTETDTQVGSTAVFFTDPLGVDGTWNNSMGADPVDGVVIFEPNTAGQQGLETTEQAVCILGASQQSLCSAVLDDFAARYGGISLPITGAVKGLPAQTNACIPNQNCDTGVSDNTGSSGNTGVSGNS